MWKVRWILDKIFHPCGCHCYIIENEKGRREVCRVAYVIYGLKHGEEWGLIDKYTK